MLFKLKHLLWFRLGKQMWLRKLGFEKNYAVDFYGLVYRRRT